VHHVARGVEPGNLKKIREQLTPGWIEHYDRRNGKKPGDSRWREFQPQLSRVFLHIWGYCEEFCKGDVDHFRPKSKFPQKVYRWSNWVLACPVCNNRKGEHWPLGGLVDPCNSSGSGNCEIHFEFDTKTCEVIPSARLTQTQQDRAQQTIECFGLNSYHHLKTRTQWLYAVQKAVASSEEQERFEVIEYTISRERELSSITRQFLTELGLFGQ
jgi:uncharacterized protein (TIGR02646 family)